MAKKTSSSGNNPPPVPPVLETVPSEPAQPAPLKPAFLIVGVGASAGGLSAFRELLQALPSDTGMGFIFIQHLDPAHISTLPALLSKATIMPVGEAQDGQIVEPNHVYVIPPNTSLGILHGKLQLLPRQKTGYRHLPIDQFFSALAEDRDSQAIGVILSGTASDGTLGLKAIKAAGGITFAQDEQSAEYDGMPHSAMVAGCVDFVLPPTQIAAELAQIARHPYASRKLARAVGITPEGENSLNKIFLLLRSRTGNDFTYYKHSTIERRLRRRMLLHKLTRLPDYIKLLQQQPTEVDELFQDLLINVTSFFRDPDAFAALKREIFPHLIKQHGPETPVRVWVPGCSSGEEAYTIAMLWLEFLNEQASTVPLQVFATDIDAPAIDTARLGIYP
ncbi:MAG TPA: chemotaxis protein CheB, partial [Candidatus Competibacteraceae bacterium]|nr:chemotaxis protein CheB [Candidatus Competibacteraceae bacterium]